MDNSFASKIIECFGEDYFNKIWNSDNIIDPWKISWKANINIGKHKNAQYVKKRTIVLVLNIQTAIFIGLN